MFPLGKGISSYEKQKQSFFKVLILNFHYLYDLGLFKTNILEKTSISIKRGCTIFCVSSKVVYFNI